ncbi:MAG TPA: glucokinase [Anaerolineales bacterium]|nr:glucokinase [Anaerolineales bacterium]HRQ92972.1 glucokinase [Anaerolineales bacterium]
MPSNSYILAGDLGATKTNIALFAAADLSAGPQMLASYLNAEHDGLHAILRAYLQGKPGLDVRTACFGVAGPVIENHVRMINLDWEVDAAELCAEFAWQSAWLINDLKALANAVPLLPERGMHVLQQGVAEPEGSIAVIAPGTGLGIGYLTSVAGKYTAYATEGGHASFAPETELQQELLAWLRPQLGQVAIEHVCAGVGLPNLYDFIKASGHAVEPDWLAEELATQGDDNNVIIVNHALAQTPGSDICQLTLQLFVEILGATAGNLALGMGATGGVYLGGGIPPRIQPALQRYGFMKFFLGKVGYEEYLQRFPVRLILDPGVALLGAAAYAQQQ